MRIVWLLSAAALLLGSTIACAGSGSLGSASWDGGIATETDALQAPQKILRDNQYVIERTQGSPDILVLTRWHFRSPLPEEEALGLVETRTRFIVEGRPRTRNPSGTDLFSIRIRVENEGRASTSGNWVPIEMTSDFRDYARRIATAISDEIEMGTRVID